MIVIDFDAFFAVKNIFKHKIKTRHYLHNQHFTHF